MGLCAFCIFHHGVSEFVGSCDSGR
jgi:hypothetical protein